LLIMLEKEKAKGPFCRQIREVIFNKIVSGELKVGDKLPSEDELARSFGVSRMTVREALNNLLNDGYVSRVQGAGTFVSKLRKEGSNLETVGFMKSMTAKGFTVKSRVLISKEEAPTRHIAEKLDISKTHKVYHIKRVRFINNDPIVIQDTYIRKDLCPGLLDYEFAHQSLYDAIKEICKDEIRNAKDRIEAIQADSETAELLNVPEGFPLLYVQRIGSLGSSKRIELTYSWYRSDQYVLELEYK